MATVDYTAMPTDVIAPSLGERVSGPTRKAPKCTGFATVRLQQGASLRSVARNSGVDVRQLRLQEQETTDMRLSDLHRWQKSPDVPLGELLVEPDPALSPTIMDRARMVGPMKTATAIRERSEAVGIRRLAQMLCEQLTEIMPELVEVSPWHDYGQRAAWTKWDESSNRTVSDDVFRHAASRLPPQPSRTAWCFSRQAAPLRPGPGPPLRWSACARRRTQRDREQQTFLVGAVLLLVAIHFLELQRFQ